MTRAFGYSPDPWKALPVGASRLAMAVNDDVGILDARGALGFFASVLAPTGVGAVRGFCGWHRSTVGASRLARVVNDDVGILDARGALGFFASVLAPTGVGLFADFVDGTDQL
ncbi:hypothetical protein ASE98_24630 [Pseudomonas sp. Leaf48]|nr:hypothetical protein ASE98_24630 [Pseudomonas sp. Leaf48]